MDPSLFFAIFLGLFSLYQSLLIAQRKLDERNLLLRLLGAKRNGRLLPARTIFSELSLSLEWEDDKKVCLHEGSNSEGAFTELVLFLNKANIRGFRMEIHPQLPTVASEEREYSLSDYLKPPISEGNGDGTGDGNGDTKLLIENNSSSKPFGLSESKLNFGSFGEQYKIMSNDEYLLDSALDEKALNLLEELNEIGNKGELQLRLVKYTLKIRKRERFSSIEELESFHDISAAFSLSLLKKLETDNATKDATKDATNCVTDDITQDITDNVTNDITDDVTDDVTDDIKENIRSYEKLP